MVDRAGEVVEQPLSPEVVEREDLSVGPLPEHTLQIDKPTTVRYRVIGWLATASALAYLCRNALGVAESRIRDDLGMTLAQSGSFMGAFFWSYALFQVPTGAFSHKYGTRVALAIFTAMSSFALFATAVAPGYWFLIAAQLVMGIAQAGFFPTCTNSVNHWMPMARRSLGGGMLSVGMQVGAILAAVLTGLLIQGVDWNWRSLQIAIPAMGWRLVFFLFAIPGLVWAVAFYIRFRDRPEHTDKTNHAERTLILAGRPPEQLAAAHDDHGPTDWMAMLTHRGLWLIHGQQMCRAAGYMFFASWFPTFLQETRGVSIAQSGYMQGVVFAGALTGSFFGGLVTDWIWRNTGNLRLSRSGVGTIALGICGTLILGSWFVDNAILAITLLAFGVLFASFAGPAMMAAVIDVSGSRVAQVLGAVNMTGNLAVAACPIVVGWIFERTDNWNLVLVLFAGIYLFGAVCWAFVDPRVGIFQPKAKPADA